MAKTDTPTENTAPAENTPAPEENPEFDLSVLAKSEVAEEIPAAVNVPQEVKDFVDRAHEFWQSAPKKWRQVELSSENAVDEVRKMAARFAKSTGRTFRVTSHPNNPFVLKYKVTDAVRKPTAPTEPASPSDSTSPSPNASSTNG